MMPLEKLKIIRNYTQPVNHTDYRYIKYSDLVLKSESSCCWLLLIPLIYDSSQKNKFQCLFRSNLPLNIIQVVVWHYLDACRGIVAGPNDVLRDGFLRGFRAFHTIPRRNWLRYILLHRSNRLEPGGICHHAQMIHIRVAHLFCRYHRINSQHFCCIHSWIKTKIIRELVNYETEIW